MLRLSAVLSGIACLNYAKNHELSSSSVANVSMKVRVYQEFVKKIINSSIEKNNIKIFNITSNIAKSYIKSIEKIAIHLQNKFHVDEDFEKVNVIKDGKLIGSVDFTYQGCQFKGEVTNGKFTGVKIFSNGAYVSYKDSLIHGPTEGWIGDTLYEGYFLNDIFNRAVSYSHQMYLNIDESIPSGEINWSSLENQLQGDFSESKFTGKKIFSDGSYINFKDGIHSGPVDLIHAEVRYQGVFVDNKFIGKRTYSDGTYETINDGTISGPIYLIKGDKRFKGTVTDLKFYGTLTEPSFLGDITYLYEGDDWTYNTLSVFNKFNLNLSVVRLDWNIINYFFVALIILKISISILCKKDFKIPFSGL